MMTSAMLLLLYAYCVGIVSSRKIERACYEDLAFRVLTANQQPDHSRIRSLTSSGAATSMLSRICSFRSCGCARRRGW